MASNLPADSDRAWDGLVYYKKGTFVSRYEQYWGVVRRESSRGLQRIDLFRTISTVYPTSDLFIPLNDVLHVLNREARARKFSFQILATGCKYHLAAESAEDRERWVKGLKQLLFGPPQHGIVYEHQVIIIPNSHSEKLQLSGRYILRITDSHIALFTSTGTLPTRFLYSLSHVARTRYTNFTDAGKKFSVVVIYCHNQEADSDVTDVSTSPDKSVVEEEGMFVFQTQSASNMSQTIEHRTREIGRRDHVKQKQSGSFSTITNHQSLPILEKSSADVSAPLPKPRPAPRQTRCSPITASPTSHSPENMKQKKAPIPLPRNKKLSLDSSTVPYVHAGSNGQPPTVKPRLYPRIKPRPSVEGDEFPDPLSSQNSSISLPDTEIEVVLSETMSLSSLSKNIMTGIDEDVESTTSKEKVVPDNATDVTYNSTISKGTHDSPIREQDVSSTKPIEEKSQEGEIQKEHEAESSTEDNESQPSLDEFLARILKRRRESKDVNEACDNKKNDDSTHSFLRNTTNPILGQSGRTPTSNTQTTPYYYNFPPLLRSRGLTVDEDEGEEEEEEEEEETNDTIEEMNKQKRGTIGEKQFRSEWIRRGSSVQDWTMHKEDGDSSENEDRYLKILPTLTLPARARGLEEVSEPEDRPTSDGSPDTGSPLWGTHRTCGSQHSIPSPLTQQENTTTEDLPTQRRRSSGSGRKKKLGSRRKHNKQATLSRRISATDLDLSTVPRRRSSKRRRSRRVNTAARADPLPSLPSTSIDVDSDYEWAEINEVLSDTGSDYPYSNPIEFSSGAFGLNPRRSASCTEFDPFPPEYLTIQERPPAPLPLALDDPITLYNPAHVKTPMTPQYSQTCIEEKRSTFQRTHHCVCSDNSEDAGSEEDDYECIEDSEGDYDYAAIPNRSAATLFPGKVGGEYVDINRNPSPHTPLSTSTSSSSTSSPNHTNKGPAVPPRWRPPPPPRPFASFPVTDV